MTFDTLAREIVQACLRRARALNIEANYVHEHAQTEGAWDRCVRTARLIDECIDLEVEVEDLIAERGNPDQRIEEMAA